MANKESQADNRRNTPKSNLLRWISESGATEVRISESASPQGLTRPKHYYMRKGIFFRIENPDTP